MWRLGLPATVTLTLTVLVANYALWIYVYKNRGKLMTVSQLFQDEEQGEKFGGDAEAHTTSKTVRTTTNRKTTSNTTTMSKKATENDSWRPFYHRENPQGKPDLPRILFWTPIYGQWYSGLSEEGVAEIEYEGCPDRCYIANDQHMLSFSDAVVFYGRDIDPEHMPEERAPFQKWIYWSLEPPWHTPVALLKDLNNTINWTMTYRHDSDVRNDYATIRKVMPTQQPYSEQTLKEIWKGKSKTAVWAASSCKTSGKREHYVEELQKHLYVDVYGECGENACPREMAQTCYQMFARNYFFYLSLENCICKDYVTEKLYTPLLYDIIPVVYGGANYSNVAPPGSYIDALSFESPMYLARYLKKVAKNYKLYRSYFQWKGKYDIEPLNGYNFCNLCRKLHSDDFKKTSVVPDIYNWWNTTSNCRVWNKSTKKVE